MIKKTLAAFMSILVFCTTLNLCSIKIFAEFHNEENIQLHCSTEYEREISKKKETIDVFEIESLREECAKHFAQTDGTIKVIVYPFPVHIKNGRGEWENLYNIDPNHPCDFERNVSNRNNEDVTTYGHEHCDTYISQSDPNTNFGYEETLQVGTGKISYYYSNNPTIPSNATIVNAEMHFWYWFGSGISSGNTRIELHVVEAPWDPYIITYNNSGTNNSLSIIPIGYKNLYYSNGMSSSNPEECVLDVTLLTQYWYQNQFNWGIGMKYVDGNNDLVYFYSNDSYHWPCYSVTYRLDDLLLDNGYYIIYNVQLDRYLQIDPDVSSLNQDQGYMEVWSLDGDDDQQWYLRYLHNGYYKITSRASHKCLAIKDGFQNNSGARIVQESFNANYRQQWEISYSQRGYLVIRPRSSNYYPDKDWVMSTAFGVWNGDGREVVQYEYSNNNDLKDEWIFYKISGK